MEVIIQQSNYQYICDKYILPIWFDYRDIDWIRYYPMKDDKMYKKIIVKRIKEEKSKDNHNLSNIYDDEKVNIYDIFRKYLAYVNNMSLVNDITDEEMEKLLNIKICDYDWNFMWSTPIYDKNSEELLLQKKLDESYIKHIIKEKYNEYVNFISFRYLESERQLNDEINFAKNLFELKFEINQTYIMLGENDYSDENQSLFQHLELVKMERIGKSNIYCGFYPLGKTYHYFQIEPLSFV